MRNIGSDFPTKTEVDVNYPLKKAQDITTPGDGTGTPWIASVVNDVLGLQQGLLDSLGIVVSGSGDTAKICQQLDAIASYASGGASFYTDTGAADVYVFAKISNRFSPKAFFEGFRARAIITNTNTGASTINVASLGVKNIKTRSGENPVAGRIKKGSVLTLRFNLSSDYWEIDEAEIAPNENLFMNGSFKISQENGYGTFTVTPASALASAEYTVDNLLIHGTGGPTLISINPDVAVINGRLTNMVSIIGDQSDNTNLFARMFVLDTKVGGKECTVSMGFLNASGGAAFDPLISINVVNNSRAIQTSPITDQNMTDSDGSTTVAGDGAIHRMSFTFAMPSDASAEDRQVMVTFKLPGRDYSAFDLSLAEAKFEVSPFPTTFQPLSFAKELKWAEAYCEKSYANSTVPTTVSSAGQKSYTAPSIERALHAVTFLSRKVRTPVVAIYSPITGASSVVRDITGAADVGAASASIAESGFTVDKASNATDQSVYTMQYFADARI